MRSARQTKILEIIESQDIETQDELVAALKNASMDDSLEDIIKKALAQLMKRPILIFAG